MYQTKEARGWVGIIGAILVIIGMFMKIISVMGFGISYFSIITEYGEMMGSGTMLLCIATIALAIAGGVVYFLAKNQIGRILSIVGIICFLVSIFAGLDMGDIGDIIGYMGMGFWLMLVGFIVMILSMTLKNANASIDAAFGGGKR